MLYKKDRTRHLRRLYDLKVHKRWLKEATSETTKEFLRSKIEELEYLTGQTSTPVEPVIEMSPEQKAKLSIENYNRIIHQVTEVIRRIREKEPHATEMVNNSKETEEEIIEGFNDFAKAIKDKIIQLEKRLNS